MTERRFNTNSDDYGASTSANTRGGYSVTHNKVAIQMYQLPESIIETLRRNGPSILEGDYSRGVSSAESIVDTEPAMGSEAVVEPAVASVVEPAKVTPAVVARRTAKPTSVGVLDAEPAVSALAITPDTTQERASLLPYLVPYSVKRSLAKVSFNRIDSTSSKKLTEVRSTEPTVEPASVADIEKDAVVNVDGEQSVERARLIEFRVVKALGETATHRKRGIKETLKSIWSQERKLPKMAFALGAASVALAFGGDKVLAMQESTDGHRIMHTASSEIHNTVVSKPIRSTVIGGNGEVSADPRYYDGRGYMPGDRDGNVVYSADMGIGNGRDSDTSIEEGSAKLVDQYYANKGRGEHTHITAYSFGTYSAQDAAWRIYAENGNKWPDDVTIDLIGGAQTDESIGKGAFGKVGMGLIGLRNSEHDRAIPPGAKVRMFYNDRDPYASGGNESGLSLLYSIAGIGYGTHEVPDRNDPNVTWTMRKDANGIEHWIAHRKNEWVIDALERAGIKVMDTHSANEAIRALFPRNDDPNAPPPEADVRKALTLGARALDRQIDPSGNTKIFETVVENMPEPWKVLMNDSWNGINRAADAIARAAADPSPQNIQHAFNVTMSEIGNFMGGVQQIMGNQPEQSVKTWTVGSIGDIVKDTTRQYMGQEVDITPQLNQFADVMMATAKQWAAEAAANAEKNQTLGQQGEPLTIATQAVDQIPQNNPLITLNTPAEVPVNISVPGLSQQGQAPAVEVTMPESSRVGLLPEVKLPEVPAVVAGTAPAPSDSSAEITPPSPSVIAEVPVQVADVPQWNPPAPEPEPVWNPPVMPEPVYEAPEPVWNPPASVPAPPVFEAPAPPPPPPPPIQLPSFQMPSFDLGNIFGGSAPAPSAPAFVPSSPTSIPSLNDGMILEPVG